MGDDGPLTVRVSVASGFRAPDFKELYLRFVNASAGYAVTGNANLSPERSTNLSADAEWGVARTRVRVSAFHNRFRDFIETVGPDGTGTYTYDNVALGTTRGIELDLRQQWRYLGISSGYGYLATHNKTDGGPLLGRAPHRANVTIDGTSKSGATRGSITTTYTGRAPAARDTLGAISSRRSPMTQVNLRVSQSVFASLGDVFVGVDNLFNRKPDTEWPGFAQRLFYAGMTWKRL
jgi:outer membrane receptor for ferrienterochelin and colicins